MTFLPETYYFFGRSRAEGALVSFEKALRVTAGVIARWCVSYEMKLITPKKGLKEVEASGRLPEDLEERQRFIEALLRRIEERSDCPDLFKLFLHAPGQSSDMPMFDRHDDTCCWALHLSPKQFAELQDAWERASLPRDLFYDVDKTVCEIMPPTRFGRFIRCLGFAWEWKRCCSPKTWEMEQEKRNKTSR